MKADGFHLLTAASGEEALSMVVQEPPDLILLDIMNGHATGDIVLREAARRMKVGVRAYDSVGRGGGEEFIVVLPECEAKGRAARPGS